MRLANQKIAEMEALLEHEKERNLQLRIKSG